VLYIHIWLLSRKATLFFFQYCTVMIIILYLHSHTWPLLNIDRKVIESVCHRDKRQTIFFFFVRNLVSFILSFFLSSNPYIIQRNNMIKYKVPLSLSEIERNCSKYLNNLFLFVLFRVFYFSFWQCNKRRVYKKCSLSLTQLLYMHGTNSLKKGTLFHRQTSVLISNTICSLYAARAGYWHHQTNIDQVPLFEKKKKTLFFI